MKKWIALLMGLFLAGCSSQYQTISAKVAKDMMDNEDVLIIDVREQNEYDRGHIPSSLLIPLSTIHANNQKLPSKEKTLLIYCRSGHRSQKAAKKFVSLGYEKVYDFGGIIDWPYDIEK